MATLQNPPAFKHLSEFDVSGTDGDYFQEGPVLDKPVGKHTSRPRTLHEHHLQTCMCP